MKVRLFTSLLVLFCTGWSVAQSCWNAGHIQFNTATSDFCPKGKINVINSEAPYACFTEWYKSFDVQIIWMHRTHAKDDWSLIKDSPKALDYTFTAPESDKDTLEIRRCAIFINKGDSNEKHFVETQSLYVFPKDCTDGSQFNPLPQDSIVYNIIKKDSIVYNLKQIDSTIYVYNIINQDSIHYNIIKKDSTIQNIVYKTIQKDSIVYSQILGNLKLVANDTCYKDALRCAISMSPNPTEGSFALGINPIEKEAKGKLFVYHLDGSSTTGKPVYTEDVDIRDGIFVKNYDLSPYLTPGAYLLYIEFDKQYYALQKFIKI